jgi:hypothetical protein
MDFKQLFQDYKWYIVGGVVVVLALVIFIFKRKSSQNIQNHEAHEGHAHHHEQLSVAQEYLQEVARMCPMPELAEDIFNSNNYDEFCKIIKSAPKPLSYKLISTLYYMIYVEKNLEEIQELLGALKKHFKEEEISASLEWNEANRLRSLSADADRVKGTPVKPEKKVRFSKKQVEDDEEVIDEKIEKKVVVEEDVEEVLKE